MNEMIEREEKKRFGNSYAAYCLMSLGFIELSHALKVWKV